MSAERSIVRGGAGMLMGLCGALGASAQLNVSTWTKDAGDFLWGTGGNWNPNGAPDGTNVSAEFAGAISDKRTINLGNKTFDVAQLVFRADTVAKEYTVSGGTLQFRNATQNRILIGDGNAASHTIAANIKVDKQDLILECAVPVDLLFPQTHTISGGLFELNNTARALRIRGTQLFDLTTESNFLTGGTFIEGGSIRVKSDKSLGNGNKDVSIIGGSLTVRDAFSTTRKIQISKAQNGTIAALGTGSGGASEFKGVISGTGGLLVFGSGKTTFSADNTFTGELRVSGNLAFSKASNLGAGNEDIVMSGGGLVITSDVTTGRSIMLEGAGSITTDKTFTVNRLNGMGGIPNTDLLFKDGTGTLVVKGNNSSKFWGIDLIDGSIEVRGRIETLGGIVVDQNGKRREIGGGGTISGKIISEAGIKFAPKKADKESVEWHLDQIGDLSIAGGTSFEMGITMAGGTGGQTLGWGLWSLTGNLLLSNTASNPMTVELASLDTADSPFYVTDFDPAQAYAWKFINVNGGSISGFDPGAFVVDASRFWNMTYGGVFGVSMLADGLYVNFAPSPAPGAVGVLGMAGLFGARRKRG